MNSVEVFEVIHKPAFRHIHNVGRKFASRELAERWHAHAGRGEIKQSVTTDVSIVREFAHPDYEAGVLAFFELHECPELGEEPEEKEKPAPQKPSAAPSK